MPPDGSSCTPAAVLLDMDGTLVETEERWGEAERVLMAELGSSWTQADQAHALGGPLERVIAYMIGKSQGTHDHGELMDRLIDLVEWQFRASPLTWSPGMLDLLADCHRRGIPVALVTASSARLASIVVQALADALHRAPFAAVVTAEDVRRGKPAPDPYATAIARLGVEPGECLAIEDSPTGLRSAIDAGCQVIGIEHIAPLDGVPVLRSIHGLDVGELWSLVSRDRAQH
jgi:HAD superfamily hydrolase (TIGR01509 family)